MKVTKPWTAEQVATAEAAWGAQFFGSSGSGGKGLVVIRMGSGSGLADVDWSTFSGREGFMESSVTWPWVEEMEAAGLEWVLVKHDLFPPAEPLEEFRLPGGAMPGKSDGNGGLSEYGRAVLAHDKYVERGWDPKAKTPWKVAPPKPPSPAGAPAGTTGVTKFGPGSGVEAELESPLAPAETDFEALLDSSYDEDAYEAFDEATEGDDECCCCCCRCSCNCTGDLDCGCDCEEETAGSVYEPDIGAYDSPSPAPLKLRAPGDAFDPPLALKVAAPPLPGASSGGSYMSSPSAAAEKAVHLSGSGPSFTEVPVMTRSGIVMQRRYMMAPPLVTRATPGIFLPNKLVVIDQLKNLIAGEGISVDGLIWKTDTKLGVHLIGCGVLPRVVPRSRGLQAEILWRMLRGKRTYEFQSVGDLHRYLRMRVRIVDATRSIPFGFGSRGPRPWIDNGNSSSNWTDGAVDYKNGRLAAVYDWWRRPPDGNPYKCGCLRAAGLVMLKGIAEVIGATFDTALGFTSRSGFITDRTLTAIYLDESELHEIDDWVPGDMGRVDSLDILRRRDFILDLNANRHGGFSHPDNFVGENVIYLGGADPHNPGVLQNGRFWGLGTIGTASLEQWVSEVEEWPERNFPGCFADRAEKEGAEIADMEVLSPDKALRRMKLRSPRGSVLAIAGITLFCSCDNRPSAPPASREKIETVDGYCRVLLQMMGDQNLSVRARTAAAETISNLEGVVVVELLIEHLDDQRIYLPERPTDFPQGGVRKAEPVSVKCNDLLQGELGLEEGARYQPGIRGLDWTEWWKAHKGESLAQMREYFEARRIPESQEK